MDGRKRVFLKGIVLRQIRQLLKEKSWIPLEVELSEQKEKKSAQSTQFFNFGPRPIKARDLALVTRQLSTLVQSGMALEEALQSISMQSRNPRVSAMILAVRAKVLEGHSLAIAFAEFPKSFPEVYRATVASGEHSGHLDAVLDKLAEYTEDKEATQGEVKKALIYPVILVIFSIGIVVFLLNSVVPKIVGIFEGQEAELPGATKFLLAMSEFTQSYFLIVLIFCAAVFMLFLYQLRSSKVFTAAFHKALLKTPWVNNFILLNNVERFSSTLAILVRSGVPLVEAINITQQVATNLEIKSAIEEVCTHVSEGGSLAKAMNRHELFPPMLVQMIGSGERSGELDQMLDRAARNQQRELESYISNSLSLFTPFVTMAMAGIVFFIVLAIMMPMIQLNEVIG